MLELSDNCFKTAIIKMFQQAITNALETNEKEEKNFSRGIKAIKIKVKINRTEHK